MSAPLHVWLPSLARFELTHPLRRLAARADARAPGPVGYLAGLSTWFDAPQPLPAGALTRELAAGDAGDALWLCADPAWVEPDLTGARLLACGHIGLSVADAEALAEPLAPLLQEQGMTLLLTSPDRWHLRLPPGTAVPSFPAPEQALGENLLQHLPQGPEGRRWRILQNEIQVLLHQHPLNARRRAAGQPPINSLWLWGPGTLPGQLTTSIEGVVSDDPLVRALASQADRPQHSRPQAGVALDLSPGWLLDLQDLAAGAIADWSPILEALVRRHVLRLVFASGECVEHRPWHRWRFWRGTRA